MLSFEMQLLHIGQISLGCASEHVSHLSDITAGIYEALRQRLSPHLVDANTLREALTEIGNKALQLGYSTLTQVVLHVFELPVSVYRTKDGEYLDILCMYPSTRKH